MSHVMCARLSDECERAPSVMVSCSRLMSGERVPVM